VRKSPGRLIYICICLTAASMVCGAEVIVSVRAALGAAVVDVKTETQTAAAEFVRDLEGDLMGLLFDQGHIAFNLPAVISPATLKLLDSPDVLSQARASNADLMILCEIQLGTGQTGKAINGLSCRVSVVRMNGKTLGLSSKDIDKLSSLALTDLITRIRAAAVSLLN
jgi:hypothetical protein